MIDDKAAGPEVRGVVLPAGLADILLPSALVVEVIAYQEPAPLAHAPPWLLGTLNWRERDVPVVWVAAAAAVPAAVTRGPRARLAICYTPNGRPELPYLAFLSLGSPRLARFTALALQPIDALPANPFVLHALTFNDNPAWIPDMDAIEGALIAALAP